MLQINFRLCRVLSGDTNASVDPSCDSAMWLTLAGDRNRKLHALSVGCRPVRLEPGHRRRDRGQQQKLQSTDKPGYGSASRSALLRSRSVSDPESALSANDKSLAD